MPPARKAPESRGIHAIARPGAGVGTFSIVNNHDVKPGVLRILRTLNDCGYRAYLNGGCVRDLLMGREPKDWDVATDAAPEAVRRLFERTVDVGARYGIVTVLLDDGSYEVARFRRDGEYEDGRRPREVEFTGPEADARRRDFTMNGMFYDAGSGRVIDYVGGREDIGKRLIRAIGDPEKRFSEDYLRMLRAVRFAARLDFAIEPETLAAIRAGAERISEVSAERIRDELTLILTEGGAAAGARLLMDLRLMPAILPEVADMEGVPQPPEFHPEGDVWTHVCLMLEHLEEPTRTLAWGVLLHDIGKPSTYAVADRIRFNRHEVVGAEMAGDICRRLRMAKADVERISQLTAHHMRFRNVREMRSSKLKRFLREEYFPELLELHRIDCLASHGMLDLHEFCSERLAGESREDLEPSPLVNGRDLIAMGFSPGPRFKEILAAVEDAQLEGAVRSREAALELVRERFRP